MLNTGVLLPTARLVCRTSNRTALWSLEISVRCARSASTEQLDVPTCGRSTIGGRAFPVAGAKVWNGLPSDITSASSLSVFKNRLKTYLFRRCYETVWLSITFPFPSHYLPPQNSGPCNSFYCLGHSKNVYDDDDDDLPKISRNACSRERKCADTIGTVPVPRQAIFNAKILIYFSSKIYGSNFIKQNSETVMVWNYQNADCGLRKRILCHLL